MTNTDAKRRASGRKNLAVVGFLFGGGAAMAIANSGVAHADTAPEPHLPNPIVNFVEQQYQAPKPGTYYSEGVSQAWCANFVSYALREAGAPLGGINGWRNPAVVGLQKTFADKGILENRNYVPKPGDVVLYGGDHTNIVVEVHGDEIVTVGGNEDRGGISRRVISRNAGKITGYGRTSELVTQKPEDAPVDAFVAPAPAPAPEPHPVWGAPPPPPVPFDAVPPAPFVEPAPPAPVDHAVNPAPAPGPELPPAPVDPFLPPPPPPAPVDMAPPAPVDPFLPPPPAPAPSMDAAPPAPVDPFLPPPPPPPPAPMPWEQPAPAPAPEFFAPPAPEQLPPPPPAPEPAPAPAPEAIPAADQLPIPPGPEGIWLLSALP